MRVLRKVARVAGESVLLLFVGFANLFYNWGLFFYESLLYGRRLWWWRLRWEYFRLYFLTRLRGLVERESAGLSYSDDNFIYGETPCITVDRMFKAAEIDEGVVFVDLGCGRGLASFYAYYLKNCRVRGYDLISSFVKRGNMAAADLGAGGVEFYGEDFLKADISDAGVVYIAGTTFTDEIVGLLNLKLAEAPAGSVIITLSYPLSGEVFSLFREEELYFSWGKTHVYYHRRK